MLAALVSPAAAKPPPPPSFFGIAPQTELTEADYAQMRQGNFGTLRMTIPWAVVDPVAPAGDYDWSFPDRIIGAAAAHGLEIQPLLSTTPDWVAESLDGATCDRCFLYGPRSKPARDAWSQFAAAAVARYGEGGDFWQECGCGASRPIDVWQIWNEQNSGSFYLPKPSPRIYAKLLSASAGAIRSVDPGAEVILGGMAELDGVPNVMPAHEFLEKLYDIKGAKLKFDGVSSHPYGSNMDGVRSQVDLLRREMVEARDGRTGMYVTEVGWSSVNGGNWLNLGATGQARMINKAYRYFTESRRALRLRNVVYFTWEDSSDSTICEWCGGAGLFDAASRPKAAYGALTRFTGGS